MAGEKNTKDYPDESEIKEREKVMERGVRVREGASRVTDTESGKRKKLWTKRNVVGHKSRKERGKKYRQKGKV
jgi:hypothetical protein